MWFWIPILKVIWRVINYFWVYNLAENVLIYIFWWAVKGHKCWKRDNIYTQVANKLTPLSMFLYILKLTKSHTYMVSRPDLACCGACGLKIQIYKKKRKNSKQCYEMELFIYTVILCFLGKTKKSFTRFPAFYEELYWKFFRNSMYIKKIVATMKQFFCANCTSLRDIKTSTVTHLRYGLCSRTETNYLITTHSTSICFPQLDTKFANSTKIGFILWELVWSRSHKKHTLRKKKQNATK